MKTLYYYLFYCFYSLYNEKVEYKEEGANTMFGIVVGAIVFSFYFYFNILFERNQFLPKLEVPILVVLSLLFWFFSRQHLLKREKYKEAIMMNDKSNRSIARIIGFGLIIGQLILFIYCGVSLSKFLMN